MGLQNSNSNNNKGRIAISLLNLQPMGHIIRSTGAINLSRGVTWETARHRQRDRGRMNHWWHLFDVGQGIVRKDGSWEQTSAITRANHMPCTFASSVCELPLSKAAVGCSMWSSCSQNLLVAVLFAGAYESLPVFVYSGVCEQYTSRKHQTFCSFSDVRRAALPYAILL